MILVLLQPLSSCGASAQTIREMARLTRPQCGLKCLHLCSSTALHAHTQVLHVQSLTRRGLQPHLESVRLIKAAGDYGCPWATVTAVAEQTRARFAAGV